MIRDPYSVLGVSQGATQDEIKKAYRRKAKENHPDLHPDDPNATQKMNEINEAYDMLMNPEKYRQRQAQEEARQNARQGYGGAYGPFGGYSGYGGQGQQSYGGQYSQGQQPYGSRQGSYGPYGFDFEDIFGFGFGQRQQGTVRPTPRPGDSPELRRVIELVNGGQYQQAVILMNGIPSTGRDARWYYLAALAHQGMGNTTQALDFVRRAVQLSPNDPEIRSLWQQLNNAGQTYDQTARGWSGFGMDRACLTCCAANMLINCVFGRGFYWCC